MKSATWLLIIAILFSACSKESIKGSGAVRTEVRSVNGFTRVSLEGGGIATIVQGNTQEVKVTGYENLLPIYKSYVANGTLVLKFDEDYYNVRNNNIQVEIVVPQIEEVSINGSGDLSFKNFTGTTMDATINGSGRITGEASTYSTVHLSINGSGNLRARGVQSQNASADISGSGNIDVTCLQKLVARISGSGSINYWGSPTDVDTQISGSGKVLKK